jgi:hypothetical protein
VIAYLLSLWALLDATQPFDENVWGFLLAMWLLWLGFWRLFRRPSRGLLVGVISLALILLDVPMRVAFFFHQSAFERRARTHPSYDGGCLWEGCPSPLGLYTVDDILEDSDGGVYLRTGSEPDWTGPDIFSHGFAWHPNPHRTPFGHRWLRWKHVYGDWYAFSVSNCGQ